MKRNLPYLQVMAMCKPKLRKMLIAHTPSDVVMAICECALNLLKAVIPLTLRQKRVLSRYKTYLRALANKKVSQKRKEIGDLPNYLGSFAKQHTFVRYS